MMKIYRVPAFTKKSTVSPARFAAARSDDAPSPVHALLPMQQITNKSPSYQLTNSPIPTLVRVVSALSGGLDMIRRTSPALFLAVVFLFVLGAASLIAAPVRLARHPDSHAGKITFSYLGD